MTESNISVKRSLSEDDGNERESKNKVQRLDDRSRVCPYLDTIDRSVLDFDFEKLCSVSLSHLNVYACLVCGKYFQGRGQKSHAYTHSVQEGHNVFLNLETKKFYCLPDNYEVIDTSLEDITYVLNPTFTDDLIHQYEMSAKMSRAFDSTTYLPGIVGLNNIKANDYCNVILQALSHVAPLRNYFLKEENYKQIERPPGDQLVLLTQRFGELIRKLWNPRNFKAHVSPHEMLQAIVLCSKKKFQITEQGDSVAMLSWFLNALHMALNGTKKVNSSIISKTFRGKMRVYSQKVPSIDVTELDRRRLLRSDEYQLKVEEMPFMYLTLDLPAAPLYPDDFKENTIPQVPMFQLLNKFNGVLEKEYKTYRDSTIKRFELTKLPKFIILCIQRFTKNQFSIEKNPTIVNFPVKGIDFGDLLAADVKDKYKNTTYDLIANVVHDDEKGSKKGDKKKESRSDARKRKITENGTYRVHILHGGNRKWYEMQDLHVTDILPQMITLSEAYVQIYQRRDTMSNVDDAEDMET